MTESDMHGFVKGSPRLLPRLEGLLVLIAATLAFGSLEQSWWLYAALFLVPDISFAGYLAGKRFGAGCYNAAHSYLLPLMVLCGSSVALWPLGLAIAAIWIAHIGFDRALGYGLKYSAGFHYTHLGRIGRNQAAG